MYLSLKKNNSSKILFITPYGGLTGSEMMLWYLANQLTKENVDCSMFCCKNGELLRQKNAFKCAFHEIKYSLFYRIWNKLSQKLTGYSLQEKALLKFHKKTQSTFWYINTAVLPWVAKLAHKKGIPYAIHYHELPTVYSYIQQLDWNAMNKNAQFFVACSSIVKKRMIQSGISQPIEIVHECISHERIKTTKDPDSLKLQLNIPRDAFVWLMSGTADVRKGVDFVPDVMEILSEDDYFVWVGVSQKTGLSTYVENRAKNEFNNRLLFTGQQKDAYYDFLNMCDAFVLTSREDPFPLVMIEAAALGKPIIAFESGGVTEFLQDGMGLIVREKNAHLLAEKMNSYKQNQFKIYKPEVSTLHSKNFDVSIISVHWIENVFKKYISIN